MRREPGARFPVPMIGMPRLDRRLLIGIALTIASLGWLSCKPAVRVAAVRAQEGPLTARVITNGKVEPVECALFAKACTPLAPIGPCMVSTEGTCAAWYKYGRPRGEGN